MYDSVELEDESLFSSRGESADWGLSSPPSRSISRIRKSASSTKSMASSADCKTLEVRFSPDEPGLGKCEKGSLAELTATEEVIMNFLERSTLGQESSEAEDPVAVFPQCVWPLIAYQQAMVAGFWLRIFRFLIPARKKLADDRIRPADAEQPSCDQQDFPIITASDATSTDVNADCIIWSAPRGGETPVAASGAAAAAEADLDDATSDHLFSVPQLAPLSPSDEPLADSSKLLPPLRSVHLNRKTLVLDLDETLIHSVFTPIMNADFVISLDVDGRLTTIYVHKRPGVEEFLRAVAQVYEVVVFTASMAGYANALVDLLDPQRCLVHHRLFRDSCIWWRNSYVKDLTMLGRDLTKTMIVDNSPLSYAFQPENGIAIPSYYDEQGDRELAKLVSVLMSLATVEDDVRLHLGGMGSVHVG
ncbi:hypothetical protein CLOM_g17948 [Closterium sp. NIES-68]|nr:hypothetical protein CLOM_g17948 [Closterium sp. NIES-68]